MKRSKGLLEPYYEGREEPPAPSDGCKYKRIVMDKDYVFDFEEGYEPLATMRKNN